MECLGAWSLVVEAACPVVTYSWHTHNLPTALLCLPPPPPPPLPNKSTIYFCTNAAPLRFSVLTAASALKVESRSLQADPIFEPPIWAYKGVTCSTQSGFAIAQECCWCHSRSLFFCLGNPFSASFYFLYGLFSPLSSVL